MQKDRIDIEIKNKLKDRELKPSVSAWERLSIELDKNDSRKKRNKFLYLAIAANVALLMSLSFFYFDKGNEEESIESIIVQETTDSLEIKKLPIEEIVFKEEAIVELDENKEEVKKELEKEKKTIAKEILNEAESKSFVIANNMEDLNKKEDNRGTIQKEIIEDNEVAITSKKKEKNENNSRIKINSEDLLYAVTHTPEEVRAYYVENKIKRKDVLDTIKKELRKSNLRINPEIILAEVEKSIEKEEFKGNFIQKLKTKISDIAIAIADRNK